MCDILEQSLKRRKSHPNLLKAMAGVVMDPLGRCVGQHELDTVGTMTLPKSTWGEVRVRALVTALVHVLCTVIKLGVKEVQWLRHDYPAVGCVLPFWKHTIFIKAMHVLHPLDVVGTTIHEMAHHMVSRCGHHHESGDNHCKWWEDATKYLTVLLRVSEIWMPLFFSFACFDVYIHVCVVKLKIIANFVFYLQVPKVKQYMRTWPILTQLSEDLGAGWENKIIHGVSLCIHCPAYWSSKGQERLRSQVLQSPEFDDYVGRLDIRIHILQHKLAKAIEEKENQKKNQNGKREGAGEEEKRKKMKK